MTTARKTYLKHVNVYSAPAISARVDHAPGSKVVVLDAKRIGDEIQYSCVVVSR